MELSEDVFDFAYSQDAPVTMDLPGIHVIVEIVGASCGRARADGQFLRFARDT